MVGSISVCTANTVRQCQYLQAFVQNSADEPTSILIEKVKAAVSSVQAESRKALPFGFNDCERVIKTLDQRKVSKLAVITGYFFFFLIIPAILAYFADKNNRELELQIINLYKLSDALKKNSPAKRIETFNQTLDSIQAELQLIDSAPTELAAGEGGRLTADVVKKINSASSIQSKFQKIYAEVAELNKSYAALESVVSSEQLPQFPREEMVNLEQRLDLITLDVADGVAPLRLFLEGEPLEVAERFRDAEIDMARAKIAAILSGDLPVQAQTLGIINGGNSCYMASVIQSMRLNPVSRYLVDRQLPQKAFDQIANEKDEPSINRNSSDVDLMSQGVQSHLRSLFEKLDSGVAVSGDEINDFREFLGIINPVWAQKTNGYYEQQDAIEFRGFLENILHLNTIQVPLSDDCFSSGLQQNIVKQSVLIPKEDYLFPSESAKERYVLSEQRDCTYSLDIQVKAKFFRKERRAIGARTDVDLGFITDFIAKDPSDEKIPGYKIDLDNRSEDVLALRERLKVSCDPNSVRSVMQGPDGRYFKIGSVVRCQKFENNPPSLTFNLKRVVARVKKGRVPSFLQLRASGATPFPDSFERRDVSDPNGVRKVRYEISSCVCHLGDSPTSGHYINYTKIGAQWYCFNDGSVYPAPDFNPLTSEDLYFVQYNKVVALE